MAKSEKVDPVRKVGRGNRQCTHSSSNLRVVAVLISSSMRDGRTDKRLSMVAQRGAEVPGATRVAGFEGMILKKGPYWQEFRDGLSRSVRLESFTADEG